MKHKCNARIDMLNGVLMVEDEGGEGVISVTNDIENVVADLQAMGLLHGQPLIYCDSEGVWDGIKYNNYGFDSFVALRETHQGRAIQKAKLYREQGRL